MGMLDGLFSNDPQSQGILALASGLLSNRGNFGQNVGASMQQGQGAYSSATAAQNQAQRLAAQDEWYRQRAAEQSSLAAKNAAAQDRADAASQAQQDAQNGLISALTPPLGTDNPTMGPPQWSPDKGAIERAYAQLNPQAMIPYLLSKQGIGPDGKPREPTGEEAAMNAFLKLAPADRAAVTAWKHPAQPQGQNQSSDAAIDVMAENYIAGKNPPTRNSVLFQAVVNRATQKLAERGIDPGALPAIQTDLASGKMAAGQLEKQRAMVGNFEETANRNADLALSLAGKGGGGTSFPVLNSWLMAGGKATGNPDVTAFHNAVATFQEEYAKVMSGSMGSAAATDSARAKAEQMLNANLSPQQLQQNIQTMRQEMANRTMSIDAAITRNRGRVSNATHGGGASAVNAPPPYSPPMNPTPTLMPNAPGSDPQLDAILKKYQ